MSLISSWQLIVPGDAAGARIHFIALLLRCVVIAAVLGAPIERFQGLLHEVAARLGHIVESLLVRVQPDRASRTHLA